MSIRVNMNKARDIMRAKLRSQRRPLLEKLDTDFIIALEEGDDAARDRIVKRKQKLRDVTKSPEIEAAQTPEELKALRLLDDE